MPIGSGGHWRDTTGSQTPGTTFAAFPFNTEVKNPDGTYSRPSSTLLEFEEPGDYLIMWTIRADQATNGRCNIQSRLTVATGSGAMFTSYLSGFCRDNSANEEVWTHGFAFYRAAANDQVQVDWRRDDDAMTGGTVVNLSNLTAVRLWDGGSYGIYTDATGSPTLSGTTPNDVDFDATPILQNDTSSIERQTGSTDFRLKKARRYLIAYSVAGNGGNTRTQRVSQCVVGSTYIPGTDSYFYQKDASNQYGGLGGMFIYDADGTNEDISVQVWQGDGTNNFEGGCDSAGSWTRASDLGGLFIAEIPPWVQCFGTHDSTGAQDVTTTSVLALNAARDVDFIDGGFSSVSNTQVQLNQPCQVLVAFGNVVCARGNVSASTRANVNCYFEFNGNTYQASADGNYSRGNQGSTDTFGLGFNPGMIVTDQPTALIAGGTIEMVTQNLGDSGGQDQTRPNRVGMFGMIGDTFNPNPPNKARRQATVRRETSRVFA